MIIARPRIDYKSPVGRRGSHKSTVREENPAIRSTTGAYLIERKATSQGHCCCMPSSRYPLLVNGTRQESVPKLPAYGASQSQILLYANNTGRSQASNALRALRYSCEQSAPRHQRYELWELGLQASDIESRLAAFVWEAPVRLGRLESKWYKRLRSKFRRKLLLLRAQLNINTCACII